MMPVLSLQNFLSWAAQVSVLALIGAALPAIFRIRHPRSHLAYCYALLLACIVLPLIQPWQHPFVPSATGSYPELPDVAKVTPSKPAVGAALPWRGIVGWTLFAGIVARLCWFLPDCIRSAATEVLLYHYSTFRSPCDRHESSLNGTPSFVSPRTTWDPSRSDCFVRSSSCRNRFSP